MSIDLSSSSASSTLRQPQQSQNDLIYMLKAAEKNFQCENSMEDFNDEKPKSSTLNAYYNTVCYQDSSLNSSLNSKISNSLHSNKCSIGGGGSSSTKSSIHSSNQNNFDKPRESSQSNVKKETLASNSNSNLKQHSSSNASTSFKLYLYKFLLSAITFTILFAQMFQIYLFQFIYFIRIQYEQKVHRRYFNTTNNNVEHDRLISPTHVCVVLNQDIRDQEIIYDKLSLVTEFFSAKGVKYLSFYKFEGIPLEVKERLTNEFHNGDLNNNNNNTKNNNTSPSNDNLKHRFESKSHECSSHDASKRDLKLNFLSYANGGGKDIIVKTCKKISNKIKHDQLKLSDLNQDFIDTQILESTDLVEPELIINIGNHDTVVGFSPWHIRLSEIIETNDSISLELDEVQVEIIINKALNSLFGEIGMTSSLPKILKFDATDKKLIVEVTDKGLDGLRQALCLSDGTIFKDVNATKLTFKILNVIWVIL